MTQLNKILLIALFVILGGAATWVGIYFQSTPFSLFHSSQIHPPTPLSIGVVDINMIKNKSKAFQRFKTALENHNATIHKEILERETRLRNEFEQFKKNEEIAKEPSQESLKQKAEFDKKVAELEKIVQERREELDQEYTSGLTKIKETLESIVDDLGKSHRLTVILNKSIGEGNQMDQSIVLFCNEGFDLTDEVVRRLDKQLSSIKLQNQLQN